MNRKVFGLLLALSAAAAAAQEPAAPPPKSTPPCELLTEQDVKAALGGSW